MLFRIPKQYINRAFLLRNGPYGLFIASRFTHRPTKKRGIYQTITHRALSQAYNSGKLGWGLEREGYIVYAQYKAVFFKYYRTINCQDNGKLTRGITQETQA